MVSSNLLFLKRHIMILLRSLLFNLVMALSAVIFAVLGLFLIPFRYDIRYRFISQWAKFNLLTVKWICGLKYTVHGKENIPTGNGIVFCKHQSAWETLALQKIFPPQVWLLKRELLWIPFFGWGLALLDPIAIKRSQGSKALRQLLEQGTQRLNTGKWVIIFPEGTRVAPGQKKQYQKGGAILAEHSGYPVIPVAHNAGEYWPRRGFAKRPGNIHVIIGPPIETKGRKSGEINQLAEQWIEGAMDKISASKDLVDATI